MIKVRIVNDKKIWENFVLGQKPNIFLQSWNWGEFRRSLGEKIFRLGFWEKEKLTGVALLVKEEARRGAYLSCPGGPLLNWRKPEYFNEFVKQLKSIGKSEKVVFARVRPSIFASRENRDLFRKLGFIDAPMHMHAETTLFLGITHSEDELLRGMRKNTRYSIRRALKEDVRTQVSLDRDDVEQLYNLQLEVVKRRQFVPFSKDFFRKHFDAFLDDGQIAFVKAIFKEKTLAMGMFIFYGDCAFYHYSGSSSEHPQVCASYAILWEAIREAKRRGCKIFDFWGIASDDNPRHRFAGVTIFKKGFGGYRVDYLHAQDLPIRYFYWLTRGFETLRRMRRRL